MTKVADSFGPNGKIMKDAFEDGYEAASNVKKTLYEVVEIPGVSNAVGKGLNHFWRDYQQQVFEVIEQVEFVGSNMTETVSLVTDSMEKGKEVTAEIEILSEKVKEIVLTLREAMKGVDNDVLDEMKRAVNIIKAGKAGIKAATNMVNGVIDRFVQISDIIEDWVSSITETKEAVDLSDDRFDEGTTESVRKGIDDVVDSFKQMMESTEFTIEDLQTVGSDIIALAEKEVAMAERAAEYTRERQPIVEDSFEYDDDSWENF